MTYAVTTFPFYSSDASYLWNVFGRDYFQLPAVPPAPRSTLPAELSTALQQLRAGVVGRGDSADWIDTAFADAERALPAWAGLDPKTGAGVATTVMRAVMSGLTAMEGTTIPDVPGARSVVAAVARIQESMVADIEFANSPTPDLSRTMWNLAKISPIEGKGQLQGTLKDLWSDALVDNQAWIAGNPQDPYSQGANAMTAALATIEPLLAKTSVTKDELAPAVTQFVTAAMAMGQGLRDRPFPAVRAAFEQVMAQVYGRAAISCRAIQRAEQSVIISRGPITMGDHRTEAQNPNWDENEMPDPDWDLPTTEAPVGV